MTIEWREGGSMFAPRGARIKRRMTREQFYQELGRTRGWKVDVNGQLRSGGRCPVTAVCSRVVHRKFGLDEYSHAARLLGLRRDFVRTVINAADIRNVVNYRQRVRRKLLRSTGLA